MLTAIRRTIDNPEVLVTETDKRLVGAWQGANEEFETIMQQRSLSTTYMVH